MSSVRKRRPASRVPVVRVRVRVQQKTKQHFRHGRYSNQGYAIAVDDGPFVEGGTIEMLANTRYVFETDAPEYPLYLTSHSLGGTRRGAGRVDETPKPVGKGTLEYVAPAKDTARAFFYNCDTAAGMGGLVVVMDAAAGALARQTVRGGAPRAPIGATTAPIDVPRTPVPVPTGTDPPMRCDATEMEMFPKRTGQLVGGAYVPGDADAAHVYIIDQVGLVMRWHLGGRARVVKPFLDVRNLVGRRLRRAAPAEGRGLRGFAFHPNFRHTGLMYVYIVTAPSAGQSRAQLLQFYIDPNTLATYTPDDGDYYNVCVDTRAPRVLHEILDVPGDAHMGGCLQFGPDDGLLYAVSGACGQGVAWCVANVQSAAEDHGKALRFDVNAESPPDADGAAPAESNPHVSLDGASPYVYARGVFDCAALAWDPWCKHFLMAVPAGAGGRTRDELHVLARAGNYGWPYMGDVDAQDGASSASSDTDSSAASSGTGAAPPAARHPVLTYNHREGGGVVGAVVYRGRHAPLRRWVVLADRSGFIAAAPTSDTDAAEVAAADASADSPHRWPALRVSNAWEKRGETITALVETSRGELLVCTTTQPGVSKATATNHVYKLDWTAPGKK